MFGRLEGFGKFEGVEGLEGADGLMCCYIYCHMVRTPWEQATALQRYMALWGFGAKCWVSGMDGRIPLQTVMTSRTPAVLITFAISLVHPDTCQTTDQSITTRGRNSFKSGETTTASVGRYMSQITYTLISDEIYSSHIECTLYPVNTKHSWCVFIVWHW